MFPHSSCVVGCEPQTRYAFGSTHAIIMLQKSYYKGTRFHINQIRLGPISPLWFTSGCGQGMAFFFGPRPPIFWSNCSLTGMLCVQVWTCLENVQHHAVLFQLTVCRVSTILAPTNWVSIWSSSTWLLLLTERLGLPQYGPSLCRQVPTSILVNQVWQPIIPQTAQPGLGGLQEGLLGTFPEYLQLKYCCLIGGRLFA